MAIPRFLQIHSLHNYPAALLNRDDAGLAKRLPYGGAVRTRISSQCLKRHWRTAEDTYALKNLGVPMSVRSREIPRLIRDRLQAMGIANELAQAAVEGLRAGKVFDKDKGGDEERAKAKGKGKKHDADASSQNNATDDTAQKDALKTGQAVLFGSAEIDYLVERCAALAREHGNADALKKAVVDAMKNERKNIEAMHLGCGLESALFGRMVTSDVLTSRDAAIYVAHAFTVHEAQVESDYFTVVDDLLRDAGETGSAGIFDTELASGLYYGYVVIDVPQLVANLEGIAAKEWNAVPKERRELAGRVVENLLHLIATVSPGAKRGSTAPFEWAKFMLVEAGDWQPRSLAGAFQNALTLDQANLREAAVKRLALEVAGIDEAYGAPLARRYLAVDQVDVPGAERLSLVQLADWARSIVTRAVVDA